MQSSIDDSDNDSDNDNDNDDGTRNDVQQEAARGLCAEPAQRSTSSSAQRPQRLDQRPFLFFCLKNCN